MLRRNVSTKHVVSRGFRFILLVVTAAIIGVTCSPLAQQTATQPTPISVAIATSTERATVVTLVTTVASTTRIATATNPPANTSTTTPTNTPTHTPTHTRTPNATNVPPTLLAALNETDKEILLSEHNSWRSQYNMPPLAWDENLSALAQDWANRIAASGVFEHSGRPNVGENLWGGTAGTFTLREVVDAWGQEVAQYNFAEDSCNPGAVCGHWTQLVWWNTTRVGCGKASGGGWEYVVCNYSPPGNFMGESPFGR